MKEKLIEIKDKYLMTVDEASAYFGIGKDKIREITDSPAGTPCVLFNGSKRLIKRKKMEQYLEKLFEI